MMHPARPSQRPDFGDRERTEYRAMCFACRRPRADCYCALIRPFASTPRFVILTQPREARHRLGTGRMAHLCLVNSVLLEGVDFSREPQVNEEITKPGALPFVLYPEPGALNLSLQSGDERSAWVAAGPRLVVFVLDGTWKSVRKMVRASPNLAGLPKLCFAPQAPSNYRIRRQPRPECYSTIEAIHFVVDWFASKQNGAAQAAPVQDNLLTVFKAVIDRQLAHPRVGDRPAEGSEPKPSGA